MLQLSPPEPLADSQNRVLLSHPVCRPLAGCVSSPVDVGEKNHLMPGMLDFVVEWECGWRVEQACFVTVQLGVVVAVQALAIVTV